jgi:hypothetical protein
MSSQNQPFEPPPDWRDPRLESGYAPEYFPLCGSGFAPAPGAAALIDRRKLEFLAAYYAINVAYARLELASDEERRNAVAALNAALRQRDLLEDRYTPIGFLGEPRMEGARCVDVAFMHAPEDSGSGILASAFVLEPPMAQPETAGSRAMDARGFGRFLREQLAKLSSPDAEAHS